MFNEASLNLNNQHIEDELQAQDQMVKEAEANIEENMDNRDLQDRIEASPFCDIIKELNEFSKEYMLGIVITPENVQRVVVKYDACANCIDHIWLSIKEATTGDGTLQANTLRSYICTKQPAAGFIYGYGAELNVLKRMARTFGTTAKCRRHGSKNSCIAYDNYKDNLDIIKNAWVAFEPSTNKVVKLYPSIKDMAEALNVSTETLRNAKSTYRLVKGYIPLMFKEYTALCMLNNFSRDYIFNEAINFKEQAE